MVRPTRRQQYEEGLVLSAKVKVLRLMGAGMVTLAVVPWLGVSPAVADNDKAAKQETKSAAKQNNEGPARTAQGRPRGPTRKAEVGSEVRKGRGKARQGRQGVQGRHQATKGDKGDKGAESTRGGNNGTMKVHEDEPEPSPVRKNQPKVCDFHLHGFNFDGGSSGTWRIEAPTSGARHRSSPAPGPPTRTASGAPRS